MAVPVARSISQESEEGRGNAWDGRMVCSHDVLWIRFCGQTHQRQMWSVRGGRTLLTHAKLPVVCSHEHTHTHTHDLCTMVGQGFGTIWHVQTVELVADPNT